MTAATATLVQKSHSLWRRLKQQWRTVLNYLLFQTGWFCCILWGNPGAAIAVGFLALHLLLMLHDLEELQLILVVALCGYGIDALNSALGLIVFHPSAGWVPPLWLLALWLLFATTLRHSLAWLLRAPVLAALAAAAGGATTYLAGVLLGAGDFRAAEPIALTAIAVEWAVLFGLLSWHERRRAPNSVKRAEEKTV